VKHEIWGNSANQVKVNNADVDLNPVKCYDNPYLQGDHGRDCVKIVCPGYDSLDLDFNYCQSPLWDDYQTKALWDMDSTITGPKVPDDDLENAGRNNDLSLTSATVVSGGKFGNCLDFNGTNSMAVGATNWLSYPNAKIDFWFKPDVAPTSEKSLIMAVDTWTFARSTPISKCISGTPAAARPAPW